LKKENYEYHTEEKKQIAEAIAIRTWAEKRMVFIELYDG
jgi:hypothetical protein